ncbi:aldehyde dehydrogenase iron-sulfur subunit PaoA [Devosia sp. CN2-171]|uniref:aldehyde dehydrogenase iron-sulfur subunit PaoA n=1 Tax=Devosia sp. CN2-171 TaxID=3400909 RepID=UPI003BF8C4BE
MSEPNDFKITRRDLIAAGAALSISPLSANVAAQSPPVQRALEPTHGGSVSLLVNGQRQQLDLDNRTSLLDALREHLHLTGTKKGCDHGQCGACTVIVDGQRINSCLTLAVMHEGAEVTTVEGLGTPASLHPMQQAFVDHDGFQCGYCTPGQICSAVSVLAEIEAGVPSHVTEDLAQPPQVTAAEIRERMSGNICRCGAYVNILDAITDVAEARA